MKQEDNERNVHNQMFYLGVVSAHFSCGTAQRVVVKILLLVKPKLNSRRQVQSTCRHVEILSKNIGRRVRNIGLTVLPHTKFRPLLTHRSQNIVPHLQVYTPVFFNRGSAEPNATLIDTQL